MCTVTFLKTDSGFILTSNRDEWVLRKPALIPQPYELNQQIIYYPKDQQAGGTWIAAGKNHTLCLLNGAFEKHESKPPYVKSRGIMLLDFFTFDDINKFFLKYNFIGIENFTLVLVEKLAQRLVEIRWDGMQLFKKELDINQAYIWSSATLYSNEIISERRIWFDEWLENHSKFTQSEIAYFHRFGGKSNDHNNFLMNREDKVKTVSITSIERNISFEKIVYLDVTNEEESFRNMNFELNPIKS